MIYGTRTRVRFSFFLLDSVSSDLRDLPNLASFLPRSSIYSAYTLLSYRIEDHKYNLHGPCETRSCCNSSRTTTILLRRVIFHAKHSFFPASVLSKTCFFLEPRCRLRRFQYRCLRHFDRDDSSNDSSQD